MRFLLFFLFFMPVSLVCAETSEMTFEEALSYIKNNDLSNQKKVLSSDGRTIYFIYGDKLMEVTAGQSISTLMHGGVEAILMYKGHLLAVWRRKPDQAVITLRTKDGDFASFIDIQFFNFSYRRPFPIENIDKVFITGEDDLVVTTIVGSKKRLWAFPGDREGEIAFFDVGEKALRWNIGSEPYVLPHINNKPVVLANTGVQAFKEIKEIRQEGASVLIEYHDGETIDYKSLGFSSNHQDQDFHYSKDVNRFGLECEYSDGNRKKINQFSVRKKRDELFISGYFETDDERPSNNISHFSLPIRSFFSYIDVFQRYQHWSYERRDDGDMNAQDTLHVFNEILIPMFEYKYNQAKDDPFRKPTIRNCFTVDQAERESSETDSTLVSDEEFKKLQELMLEK